jgi:hypothetical protein
MGTGAESNPPRVVRVELELPVAAEPERVWRALVDWPAHGRWIPLTTVRVLTPSGAGVGARFVGRTGIGPLAFDDPMEIVRWEPPDHGQPGRCRLIKQGRVVLGGAGFEVHPAGDGASVVKWIEEIGLPPTWLTVPVLRLARPLIAAGITRALKAMAAEVTARPDAPRP